MTTQLKKINIPGKLEFTFCESDYEINFDTGYCVLMDSVVEDGLDLEDALDAIENHGMVREGYTAWYSATDNGADTMRYRPENPTEYTLHSSESGIELLDAVVAEDNATILTTCTDWATHLQVRKWAEGDDRDVLFFLGDGRFTRLLRDEYDHHCTEDYDPRITIVHTDDCFMPPMVAASGSIESIYERWADEWPSMFVTPWNEVDEEDRELAEAGELVTTPSGVVYSWDCFEPKANQIAILVSPTGATFEYDREGNVTIEGKIVFRPFAGE